MENKKQIMSECYSCIWKREVPGNCHIKCAKPDRGMTGNQHGINNGWFIYPVLFDPTWKTKLCDNFEEGTEEGTLTESEEAEASLSEIASLIRLISGK